MRRLLSIFAILITALLATGCARLPLMPLSDDNAKVDASKPLYLMSVTIKNEYKKRWQPKVLTLTIAKENGAAKPEVFSFRMDSKGTIESDADDGSTTYLVRFVAESGPHTIWGMNAMASAFPIHGFYYVPLHSPVPAATAGVYYLGSVKAVIRERQGNEFRAGPAIPLIDQAFAGASTGTFDIKITDAYSSDTKLFKKTFSSLAAVDIKKAILQPWDRAKAQLVWDNN